MTKPETIVAETGPSKPEEDRFRRLLTASSMIQFRLGLTEYLGHTSVRLPGGGYLIKPKHSPSVKGMDTLRPEDFIVVDDDGRTTSEAVPPSEVFVHTEIYRRRSDVDVVLHTHQPMATLMGILGAPILPLLHVHSALVAEPLPTWPCSLLVQDRELGRSLAEQLGDSRAAHLQGHGIVIAAKTVEEATVDAIHLEQIATTNLEVLKTGLAPRVVPPDEIATLQEQIAPVGGRWAYYASVAGVDESLLQS